MDIYIRMLGGNNILKNLNVELVYENVVFGFFDI